jgi:hypothetical protein
MNEDILTQLGQGQPEAPAEEPKDEIKYEDKKASSGKKIDDEVLRELVANGDNTKGMFEPKDKEKDGEEQSHQEVDEKAKIKGKGNAKPSDKYTDEFKRDMDLHPEKYYVNTPRGKMSLKEAEEKGYDPVTHRFNKHKKTKQRLDKMMSEVNDSDRAALQKLFDPKQVGLAPADAEQMGLNPTNPVIKNGEMPTALASGTPAAAQPAPTGEAVPTEGNPPTPSGNPLEALLGGAK